MGKEEFAELLALFKGKEASMVKMVMNAPLVEGEIKLVKAKDSDTDDKKVEEKKDSSEPVQKKGPGGRKEYPVTLDVLRMIDARTTNIPNYGSLVGRMARLLAVVMGKEVVTEEEDGDEEEKDGDEEEKDGENGEDTEEEK